MPGASGEPSIFLPLPRGVYTPGALNGTNVVFTFWRKRARSDGQRTRDAVGHGMVRRHDESKSVTVT